MPFVGQAKGKGRFLNVIICVVKLRNFDSVHRGNATDRSRRCIISNESLLLNKLGVILSCLNDTTRRGLACVAYPCTGAMRRPDYGDRRGGINSHVFFVSPILIIV